MKEEALELLSEAGDSCCSAPLLTAGSGEGRGISEAWPGGFGALPGLQPTDAHLAPGSLGLDTRIGSRASGALLGLPHGHSPSRQESLRPRETQSWAHRGDSTLSWEPAPPSSCLCSSLSL